MANMEAIKAIGNAWTHPATGEVRYYVNEDKWAEMIGLEILRYNTGNISNAWFKGEDISNAQANRYLSCIKKVYITEDGKVHIQYYETCRGEEETIVPAIKSAIEEFIADKVEETEDEETEQVFWFEYFDGNSGITKSFETSEEAIAEAEYKWAHLSESDKAKYISKEDGACFYVSDGEGNFIRDFQEAE